LNIYLFSSQKMTKKDCFYKKMILLHPLTKTLKNEIN